MFLLLNERRAYRNLQNSEASATQVSRCHVSLQYTNAFIFTSLIATMIAYGYVYGLCSMRGRRALRRSRVLILITVQYVDSQQARSSTASHFPHSSSRTDSSVAVRCGVRGDL